MGRLQPLGKDGLDDEGRSMWESIMDGRRGPEALLTDGDGGLVGPFNAMLRSPALGQRLIHVGSQLRFESSIETRLLELSITTTCAHWHAGVEWMAHSRLARKAGIGRETLDAIAAGGDVAFSADDERVVYQVTRQLLDRGSIEESTYSHAIDVLGERDFFELVTAVGFYCIISFIINAFEVPAPPGTDLPWKSPAGPTLPDSLD
jgi:4-carboxymuconolactone decarboxylase